MENENEAAEQTELSTVLNFLAQTFQKLADTAQRGHRDETNPAGLARSQFGQWEAYTTCAMICRDTIARSKLGKPPVSGSMLVSLYKTALDVSRQNE